MILAHFRVVKHKSTLKSLKKIAQWIALFRKKQQKRPQEITQQIVDQTVYAGSIYLLN